ncbi:MAG: hypothetical protein VXX22_03465 [Pseudomonadota bacterium]|nr:hypothetical protein [Pseudomonadota bacterium]
MAITIAGSQKCECSRLPVENYIGWHAFSEEDYKIKKVEYEKRQIEKSLIFLIIACMFLTTIIKLLGSLWSYYELY